MRLEQLIPERFIWGLGLFALCLSSALFAYELMRPRLSAYAGMVIEPASVVSWTKRSPFVESEAKRGEVLVRLPELAPKYQKKVFYIWKAR